MPSAASLEVMSLKLVQLDSLVSRTNVNYSLASIETFQLPMEEDASYAVAGIALYK